MSVKTLPKIRTLAALAWLACSSVVFAHNADNETVPKDTSQQNVTTTSGTAPGQSTQDRQAAALAFSQSVLGKTIGDYAFTDRAGRTVRLSRYRGKPLLVSFVYTACSQVCPTTTRFLAKAVKVAQDGLGADSFAIITVGFNVPFDTPESMKTFAGQQGIDFPNWEFLSPDPATVERLTKNFGFTYYATPKGFDHITQVTIVDGDGKVYRQIYGDVFEVPMLVAPLKDLVTGAPTPARDIAGVLEKVRLFCTVYDPASGRYRLNYALFIEIFAGLTVVLGTGCFLLAEWRRNRKIHGA